MQILVRDVNGNTLGKFELPGYKSTRCQSWSANPNNPLREVEHVEAYFSAPTYETLVVDLWVDEGGDE